MPGRGGGKAWRRRRLRRVDLGVFSPSPRSVDAPLAGELATPVPMGLLDCTSEKGGGIGHSSMSCTRELTTYPLGPSEFPGSFNHTMELTTNRVIEPECSFSKYSSTIGDVHVIWGLFCVLCSTNYSRGIYKSIASS